MRGEAYMDCPEHTERPMVLTERIPLVADEAGDLRVEGTRVYLEDLLDAYEGGLSPEEMVLAYPSLNLADVYAILAWALRHPEEVAAYRERVKREAQEAEERARAHLPKALLARLGRA
jgi:uncharacterized protein (DUF433 family)